MKFGSSFRAFFLFLISAFLGSGVDVVNAIPSQTYPVKKGDTLSEIAEQTYGNWIKWRDLYEWNKNILNHPDLIYPGQRLSLLGGEELDLYASASAPKYRSKPRRGRSLEWRLLPPQVWEKFTFKKPQERDIITFDRRDRQKTRFANRVSPQILIASDRLAIFGEIVSARSEYSRVFLGDQVFIRADEDLQVGNTYSITDGPQSITSKRDGRVGFSYILMGKVKIVGVREKTFIGTVTSLYQPIARNHLLIPEVLDYAIPPLVAAPTALVAHVLVRKEENKELLSEQRMVYLDVGKVDGVQPGQLFRHYLHEDLFTHQSISAKDFLIESELLVLEVQDRFSTALILQSRSHLSANQEVIAITDAADFGKSSMMQSLIQDSIQPQTLDDLDQMDTSEGLGEKEGSELHQLENWYETTPATGTISDPNEIRKEVLRQRRKGTAIGDEAAPNDGSGSIGSDSNGSGEAENPPSEDPFSVNPDTPTGNTPDNTTDELPPDIPEEAPASDSIPESP